MKADIFFFITSVSVIIITVILLIAGFYFIKMLKNFYKISTILKNYTEDTDNEIRDIGSHIKNSPLFTFIFGKERVKKESEKHSKK